MLRVNRLLTGVVFLIQASVAPTVLGSDFINEHRALFNYQMYCQGCHTPDGTGYKSVPQLKGHVDKFMASQKGREYLTRVPGAATSVLSDAELAEVLNWILREFSGQNAKADWTPYSAAEVTEYRKQPLAETVQYRQNLLNIPEQN